MLTPHFVIDTLQSTKKAFCNQFISDDSLRQVAHTYVDAQTQFAKTLVDNVIKVAQNSFETLGSSCFLKNKE